MTSNKLKKGFFIFILLTLAFVKAFAQDDEPYYFFDLPIGFEELPSEDTNVKLYQHEKFGITLISKVVNIDENTSLEKTTEKCLENFSDDYQTQGFTWNKTPCLIANPAATINDVPLTGMSYTVELSKTQHLFILLYAHKDLFDSYFSVMYSAINSLCINDDYYYTPGILITSISEDEPQNPQKYKIKVGDVNIKKRLTINNSDITISQLNTEVEYDLLIKYMNTDDVIEAWKRYYRILYRDNYGRIKPEMEIIISELKEYAQKNNVENVDLFIAQTLLSWTQSFEYKRAMSGSESDFICLPAVLAGAGNDCDSRSFLICALLNYYGINSILLVSPEYAHAMVAIALNEPGQKYNFNGKEYLMGETTAKLTWGTIAAKMQDRTKWFAVSF